MSADETASGAAELEAYLDEEREEAQTGWRVENLIDADWCLKRIANLQREIAENEAIEAAHIQRLKLRTLALNERVARGVRFFTGAIQAYAEQHRPELCPGKKKSRALAHGSIGWRKVGGGLTVTDQAKLLEWAKAKSPEGGLVRVKEEPALALIKTVFETTGEVPDGTEPNPERDEFQVKPLKEYADADRTH